MGMAESVTTPSAARHANNIVNSSRRNIGMDMCKAMQEHKEQGEKIHRTANIKQETRKTKKTSLFPT